MRAIRTRLGCLLLAITMLLSVVPVAFASSAAGMQNFKKERTYTAGTFTDVPDGQWYTSSIQAAYEYGLASGDNGKFDRTSNMSVAMAVTLAARLHAIYHTGSTDCLKQGTPWYQVYVDYALANGIIEKGQFSNYDKTNATRAECAVMLSKAIPAAELPAINTVDDGVIPDVSASSPHYNDIYTLYRAGILTGNDAKGTFTPDAPIDRVSMITLAVRIVDKSMRQRITLKADPGVSKLTAQEISAKCADAVFYIDTYSFNGELRGSGSGFFISADGLAVTNFHVVANTSKLVITTTDGKTYADIQIIDTDQENDLVLLRVGGQDFPYLEIGNSDNLVQGQTIYAIGSPIGLQNTMSQGIVSNPNRQLTPDGTTYIQISAQISNGSSGGALLDEYGKVIGITSAGFLNASADLNLAVPISYLDALDMDSTESYWCWDDVFYPGLSYALDFGEFSDVELTNTIYTPNGAYYVYDMMDFYAVGDVDDSTLFADTIYNYQVALVAHGLKEAAIDENGMFYENDTESVFILLSYDDAEIVINAEEKTQYYDLFPSLPDAGWYFGDLPDVYNASKVDDSIMFGYDVASYYTEDSYRNIMLWYLELLKDEGFEQVYVEGDGYLHEGDGLSVACLLSDGMFVIDVKPLSTMSGPTTTANRRVAAYSALEAWLMSNYNTTLSGDKTYEEYYSTANGSVRKQIIQDKNGELVLRIVLISGGEQYATMITLKREGTTHFASTFYYKNAYDSNFTFAGSGPITPQGFSRDTNYYFTSTSGAIAYAESCRYMAPPLYHESVAFANTIFSTFTYGGESYSMADLGFTAIS